MRSRILVAFAILAGTAVARADSHDYYGEMSVIDAVTTTTFLVANVRSSNKGSEALFATTTAFLLLAPAADHAYHDNLGRAGVSFGAHFALPTLGGVIGFEASDGKNFDSLTNALVGVAIGHVAAIVADIYMAHADRRSATEPTPRMISFGTTF